MYVPSLEVILSELKISATQISGNESVSIPADLFRFLMQALLIDGDFYRDGYLAANPDIRKAIETGAIEDPRLHYVSVGYFEGRIGATPAVDEKWYLMAYPDVAAAVQAGTVASAAAHFAAVGAKELRAPTPDLQDDAAHWGRMLRGEKRATREAVSLSIWSPEPQVE